MEDKQDIKITTHDRLMRAWENSMELARDFKMYSLHMEDGDGEEARQAFEDFAVDEGEHAARFRELLLEYQDRT